MAYRSAMGAEGSLVGRDAELGALAGFLASAAPGGLVLLGEPGVGKSALWRAGMTAATELGAHLLVATPGEGEESYSGSILLDLFGDLDLADVALQPPVREALEAVLLRGPASGSVNRQAISVAVHAVLEHLSQDRQVTVFIDDVQWGDATSLEALSFAARRLDGSVQFVMTRRSGFDRSPLEAVLVRQDLRYVEPRLLTLDETARLLIQHLTLVVTPRVLRMVHEQSRGNPLFALEVGRVLVERGIPGIGEPLGVPEEMATMLGLRVRDLPEEQRTLLLAVALDPHVREEALVKLVGLDAVEAAVGDRLVTVAEGGRVRAWHPLLAAAAREGATPARQRQLHLRLADLESHPESRARHLAMGASETSEELAEVLSSESAAAAARGAVETGVELAELALARTPEGSAQRARRVLDLAARLADAGEGQRVTDFLTREIESLPVGRDRGTAWLMMLDGIVGSMANVERIIDNALAECGDDPEVRSQALDVKALVQVGMLVSGVPAALELADEAIASGATSGQGRDWCLLHSGRPPEGPEGIPHIKRFIWRGEPALAEPLLREAIASAEAEGQLRESMALRLHLLDLLTRCGRVEEARLGLAVLEDSDLEMKETADEELFHAIIEMQSGDAAEARRWATIAGQASEDFGHVWLHLESIRIIGMAALMEGRLDEAERSFRQAWEWVVRAEVRDPNIFPLAPELAETLVLLGDYDGAREVIAWLRERSEEQEHPWGLAMTARSEHLLGLVEGSEDVADADRGMTDAADRFAELGLAVDAARTRLALGSALRRRKQWGRARQTLEQSRAEFAATGAEGWAELAAAELAKVGGRQQKRSAEELTPAEEITARLAADGLSNKEIARRTNVSIHTVEVHLSRTYAKLGIRSRSQIAAKLTSEAEA